MKVLYVLKRYPRLSETFVVREILGVEAAGATVLIDSLLPPEDGPVHADVARVAADVRRLPARPDVRRDRLAVATLRLLLRRPFAVLAELLAASRLERAGTPKVRRRFRQSVLVADRVRREGVTHVHCHFATAAAEVAVPAARMAGVPVTVTAHAKDIYHHENAGHLARRVGRAQAVVTVSAFNVAHLSGVLPRRVLVRHVPNGVPVGPVSSAVGSATAPLLCVSRLVAKKGIDTLLDAVALAAVGDPDLWLELIGDGPLRDELEARAIRLGIPDRVRFLGAQPADRVEAAYAACGLVVLPCRIDPDGDRDGLPTVIVEALGRGIPVISTDVVGIPEVVRDGSTGLLVPPDDPGALAVAIEKLRADADLGQSLGARGRQLVAQRFDPARATELLLAVWQEAAR